jgi:threonylcarbamoyladenosine tRNA methylthiotransferase MtaB
VYGVAGKTFSVVALGCRTNRYEAEALASMLERRGAVFSPSGSPDIVIVLTCSITSVADSKTRKLLRRARRTYPSAVIVACGCSVQRLASGEAESLGVDILAGNRMKHEVPDALETWFSDGGEKRKAVLELRDAGIESNTSWDDLSLDRPRTRTRAFVKIQDGCSMRCSYCIVPRVRGPETSRGAGEVFGEISGIAGSGCVEVVLTGIRLGGYRDADVGLSGLIASLSSIHGLRRLRLGSLEPFAVNVELLRAISSSPIFCPHLHLPIQSGDDGVLARMRRGYDLAGFRRTVDMVREALGDDVHISTDLIVGFPGETDAAFEMSLSAMEDIGFGKVHVFPFSPRSGTDAAMMDGRVPPRLVRERITRTAALSDRLLSRYAARWVGASDVILAEESSGRVVSGWTSHYLKACAMSPGRNFEGTEISINPKSEIRGILLGEGITSEDLTSFPNE